MRQVWIGLSVAVVAATILYIPPSWVIDLGVMPDAAEYAITARRLARFEPFTLILLGREYPPRYSFGLPALLAPAYWLPGATLAYGIYGVIVAGVVSVVLTYLLARRVGGVLAGLVAALTLLLRPNFVDWNHQIMSESSTAALAVGGALLLHVAATTESRRRRTLLVAALGAVCGIAVLVRLTNILMVSAAALALVVSPRLSGEHAEPTRIRSC